MVLKEYYSTGEAAQLLGISRSTISRKFDLGGLSGKKNPITGDRLISRESIEALMKLYNIPPEAFTPKKKRILVSSPDPNLFALISQIFAQAPHLVIEKLSLEASVLNECIEKRPDLLVIDEMLPDQPWPEIIHSLREIEELKNLRILCLAEPQEVHHYLTWGADDIWPKDLMEEHDVKEHLFSLLNIQKEIAGGDEYFEHHRRWPRKTVRLPAKIWVYPLRKPSLRDPGKALVENISGGGAFLSEMQLKRGVIPCEPFRIFLRIDQPPIKSWRAHAKVVRLLSNEESLAAGIQFVRASKTTLRMIEALCTLPEA
jgi:excisionase family DNA binding protein